MVVLSCKFAVSCTEKVHGHHRPLQVCRTERRWIYNNSPEVAMSLLSLYARPFAPNGFGLCCKVFKPSRRVHKFLWLLFGIMATTGKSEGFQGWWLALCMAFMISNMQILVLGQDAGSNNNRPTSFLDNYSSASDSQHFQVLNNGQRVQLILDEYSAAGFGSKHKYLFGKIGMRMKLVPGNSAGTVTAYYLSSQTELHDEMDFEFLGNVSGQPYILQTNIFAGGKGEREQRIYLWFDPTADFHEYSVLWNKRQIVFYVDDTPIRVYKNNKQALGTDYPNSQPVGIYSTIWNGENWATNDGWVKLNWTHAPFIATYEKFSVDACLVSNGNNGPCIAAQNNWWEQSEYQALGANDLDRLNWVRNNYLVYNYCTDKGRNPTPPAECALNVL